jgi:DNA-3-methyladenine glycosylase I
MAEDTLVRCPWSTGTPLMMEYHDREWGAPLHDDRCLFELLVLEAAQAGLSWSTILNKRVAYRAAFHDFEPTRIARYDDEDIARLLANAGIVRNRRKISATIENARAFLQVQAEFGSFDSYLWAFVGGAPVRHRFVSLAELPAKTPESGAMSKDLIKRGFHFVGPTICYAFMQSAGLVNDHLVTCFRYDQVR